MHWNSDWSGIISDIRLAVRGVRKKPVFFLVVVLVLGIGIGANTAIFSLLSSVLLKGLPFPDPGRLVMIDENFPHAGLTNIPASAPDYIYLSKHADAFSSIAAFDSTDFELSGTGSSSRVPAARVSASLPQVLEIQPLLGRSFTSAEDQGNDHVVLLSYSLWMSRFRGARDVLGTTVLLDRVPYVVIGVMPESFVFPLRGPAYNNEPAALFVPMSFTAQELQGFGDLYNHSVIGRLNTGTSLEEAQAQIVTLINQASSLYPSSLRDDPRYMVTGSVIPLQTAVTGSVKRMLFILQAAVLLLLFIACADVANLLLARTAMREREMTIRSALGSGRWRIARQLLAESLVFAAASALLGVVLAHLVLRVLVSSGPEQLSGAEQAGLNSGLLLFTIAVAVVTSGLATLLPSLRAMRVDVAAMLGQGGRSGMRDRRQHSVLRWMVIGQFALAMTLVVCTALLVRSFITLLRMNPGFSTNSVITLETELPSLQYTTATQVRNFDLQVLRAASALPGVQDMGITTALPMQPQDRSLATPADASTGRGITNVVIDTFVVGDYFRAMQIPLLRGRYFSSEDEQGKTPVVVVSKSLADKFWPHRDPIGQTLKVGPDPSDSSAGRTVIGVVGDVIQGVSANAEPQTYLPLLSEPDNSFQPSTPTGSEFRVVKLAVRISGSSTQAANELTALIHHIDRSLAITNVQTMNDIVQNSVRPQRLTVSLLGLFSAFALLLSAAGIGGVLIFSVAQRKREIGVRMAVGATRLDVLRLVLREGLIAVSTGALLGSAGALAASHLVRAMLYATSSYDPMSFVSSGLLLLLLGGTASLVPALLATTFTPSHALRAE